MSERIYKLCKKYCETWGELNKRDDDPLSQFPFGILLNEIEKELIAELIPFGGLEWFKSASRMKETLEEIIDTATDTLEELQE